AEACVHVLPADQKMNEGLTGLERHEDDILGVTPKLVLFLPPRHATELVFWASACPIGLATALQPFITLAEGGALDIPIEDTITTPQNVPSSELFPRYINKRD
ncbi:hypothetical protein QQF64_004771, partial [Cirrhinus molitorella]